MAIKKLKLDSKPTSKSATSSKTVLVHNLTHSVLPVQKFDEDGNTVNFNLFLHLRKGQQPVALPMSAVTPQMRKLEKKKMIRITTVE